MIYDFADESQVKEYLFNVETEYKFQCIHEKQPEGCQRLADFYEGVRKNYKEASEIYKKNCDNNNYMKSCFKYANYKLTGKGGDKSIKEAYRYHQHGCSRGYNQSCYSCGLMNMTTELGVGRDFKTAVDFFRKSCDNEHSESCYKLSSMFLKGTGSIARDKQKAFEYSKKACELGHIYGCSNLCVMYKRGDGVEKNEEMAAKYKEEAVKLETAIRKKQQENT